MFGRGTKQFSVTTRTARLMVWPVLSILVLLSIHVAVRAAIDCRSDPTWIGKEESCASHTGWRPRSRLWEGKLNRFEKIVMSDCVADENQIFLAQSQMRDRNMRGQREGSRDQLRRESRELGTLTQPKIINVYPDRETPLAVEVSFAFLEPEAAALRATASCIRKYHYDTNFEDRSFAVGGNNCTFMAAYAQTLVPGILAHVVELARMAWREVNWKEADYHDPATLGLRTIEHLRYNGGGKLGAHHDSESEITVVVALSHPEDYDGGEYILYDEDSSTELQLIKLGQYSALVFLSSEALHGVAPLTSGVREMLAVELWNEDDVPYNVPRLGIEGYHELYDAVDLDMEDL